jgi:hypothetical protein
MNDENVKFIWAQFKGLPQAIWLPAPNLTFFSVADIEALSWWSAHVIFRPSGE